MPSYPNSIPVLVNPTGSETMNGANLHSAQHGNANDEIEAIAAELGINPSGTAATVAERLSYLPGRNALRNGDFSIWQRGKTSFTLPLAGGASYTADGWTGYSNATTTASYITHWNGFGIPDIKDFLILVSQGQTAAANYALLQQKIENVGRFSGKYVTLSLDISCSSGSGSIGVEIEQSFGTGGSPSAVVRVAVGTIPVDGTQTRRSITFQVPSVSGKTLGTNGDDCFILNLWTSAGADIAARASNIGLKNWNVNFIKVQLEEGTVATPFEVIPYQMQLSHCQRYFYRFGPDANSKLIVLGLVVPNNATVCTIQFPVTMRQKPVIIRRPSAIVNNGNPGTDQLSASYSAGAYGTFSSWVDEVWNSSQSARIGWIDATDIGEGTPVQFQFGNATYFDFSAEL